MEKYVDSNGLARYTQHVVDMPDNKTIEYTQASGESGKSLKVKDGGISSDKIESFVSLRSNMGLGNTLGALPIANGGTGYNSIPNNDDIVSYLTGEASSSLSGNEPVFVSNLACLADVFNVYGKQVLSVAFSCTYSSDITHTISSYVGFSGITFSFVKSTNSTPAAQMKSTAQVTGTYKIESDVTFNIMSSGNFTRLFYVYINDSLIHNFYILTSTGVLSDSFNEIINLTEGDEIKVIGGQKGSGRGDTDINFRIYRVS